MKFTVTPWTLFQAINNDCAITACEGKVHVAHIYVMRSLDEETAGNLRLLAKAGETYLTLRALLKFAEELCEDVNVSKHYPSMELARNLLAEIEGGE